MSRARGLRACLLLLAAGLLAAQPALASEAAGDTAAPSLRGFTSLSVGWSDPGAPSPLTGHDREFPWNLDQRLLAEARPSERSRIEANLLQNLRHTSHAAGVERSSLLAWQQHRGEAGEASLTADSLNARWQSGDTEVTLGRQPISLATTFLFSPNDLFAPFSAQTFYRVYKPGVDAIRSETRLANLSQLTLLGVLGYDGDPSSANGWSQEPEWSRASLLGRFVREEGGFAWGLMAGTAGDHRITGGSLSGELFDWLGIRLEGHYAAPEREGVAGGTEFCLGIEHRFESSLFLRLEHFLHGQGYDAVEEINRELALDTLRQGLLGKSYSGFGAGYEFSPLVTGEFIALTNWSDHSGLISANLTRSLSDEAELAATLTLPFGDKPEPGGIGSEFGQAGATFLLEFRTYY
ncbi:MAG: hypothetical protein ACOY3Z_03440 [Thermodesulfobacteriota bacterium]